VTLTGWTALIAQMRRWALTDSNGSSYQRSESHCDTDWQVLMIE